MAPAAVELVRLAKGSVGAFVDESAGSCLGGSRDPTAGASPVVWPVEPASLPAAAAVGFEGPGKKGELAGASSGVTSPACAAWGPLPLPAPPVAGSLMSESKLAVKARELGDDEAGGGAAAAAALLNEKVLCALLGACGGCGVVDEAW